MTSKPLITLGTRGSKLALIQVDEVKDRLAKAWPDLAAPGAIAVEVIKTTGDIVQDRTLAAIGGKGLFTKEIVEALRDGRIDAAVHSMKDVPTWLEAGFEIAAILPREDPRDAWFSGDGASLDDLPAGALVGTASTRRQAQVLARRPDLTVVPIRGNVDTRLRKLAEGQVAATLLAVSGINRMGLQDKITTALAPEDLLPASGQGAIGLEIRDDDAATRRWVAALDHRESAQSVTAERACLDVLDGSCRTPIAAYAEHRPGGLLRLRALVAQPDGSRIFRDEGEGPAEAATELGRRVGGSIRAAAGEAFFAALQDAVLGND